MSKVITAETIVPASLTFNDRVKLMNTLYTVHQRIFHGLNETEFDHYVINSSAPFTTIYVYRNSNKNDVVGYFAVHRFDKEVDSQPLAVFRAEAGLVPEYRRKNADLSFFLREGIKFRLRNPGRTACFLASPVNPSMYAILARYIHDIYPKYNTVLPENIQSLMFRLADQFKLEPVDKQNLLIRKVGWITQASDEEKSFWTTTKNPHVQFYLQLNPGFIQGNGLLTYFPFTISNIVLSLIKFGFYTVKKQLKAFLPPIRMA